MMAKAKPKKIIRHPIALSGAGCNHRHRDGHGLCLLGLGHTGRHRYSIKF